LDRSPTPTVIDYQQSTYVDPGATAVTRSEEPVSITTLRHHPTESTLNSVNASSTKIAIRGLTTARLGGPPGTAVNAYFQFGPMGGFARLGRGDDIDLDPVLCAARRDQLHRQAEAFASDLNRPGVLRIEPLPGDQVTTHGAEATVVSRIQVSATDGTPGSTLAYHSTPATWTFRVVNDGGWRVCQVDAPTICGSLLRCGPTLDSTTSPSPSPSPSDDPTRAGRQQTGRWNHLARPEMTRVRPIRRGSTRRTGGGFHAEGVEGGSAWVNLAQGDSVKAC
jgi:hypothetical protein